MFRQPQYIPPSEQLSFKRLSNVFCGHDQRSHRLLYGSFVEGGPFRDVDLAVYLDPEVVSSQRFRDYEEVFMQFSQFLFFSLNPGFGAIRMQYFFMC
ncbi:MAG: hypothetical protein D6704_05785 [Nitrospirae bacterium]|nr:MAG: hypothetical protein D6704_05785 [Nitrospirota bacterium]